jgi:DNA-binding MarR family transcriptional regulator
MLSSDGDDPMTKLSDTQAVILSTASQRDDGAVLPLPETLKLSGGALTKVMDSLRNRGLIRVVQTEPKRVVITSEGMAAIGIAEDEPDTAPVQVTEVPKDAPDAQDAGTAGQEPQASAEPSQAAKASATAKGRAKAKAAKPTKAAPAGKPTPRAGTKQARMIELLRRPEGATVEQIAAATGWQNHTIRGAISGALKKKLGFNVEATRTREVGPNKVGAKGSSTVYRIVG